MKNSSSLVIFFKLITLTTLFVATFSMESSTVFSLTTNDCIIERRDVNKFYLFKANAAPIVIGATVTSEETDIDRGTLETFTVKNVKYYKGAELISEVERTTLSNFLGKGLLYINMQKSTCPEMRVFRNFESNTEFIFYLTKAAVPDEHSLVKESTVKVPTLAMFAQPDVYKPKIDRNLRNNLFCKTCIKVAPYFSSKHVKKMYNVIEGKRFTLDCKARGFPLPHNSITSNGTDIMTIIMQQRLGDRYSLISKGRKIQLVIENVRPEDESLYRCVGTDFYNEEAVRETLLTVSEKWRPSEATELGPSSIIELDPSSKMELNWSTAKPKTGQQCPDYYQGYCQNGATCYWIPEDEITGCICPPYYYGRRCQDYVPFGKLYQIRKDNPRFWTIFTFIILASCLIVALIVMAKQYWNIKTMKRRARDQSLQSPTFAFDYEVEPVPKRFSGVREVSFTALDNFERFHCQKSSPAKLSQEDNSSSMDKLCVSLQTYSMAEHDKPATEDFKQFDLSSWTPSNHQSNTLPSPKKFSPQIYPDEGSNVPFLSIPEVQVNDVDPLGQIKVQDGHGQPERDSYVPRVPPNFAELNKYCKETDMIGTSYDQLSVESSEGVSDYASTRMNEYVFPSPV